MLAAGPCFGNVERRISRKEGSRDDTQVGWVTSSNARHGQEIRCGSSCRGGPTGGEVEVGRREVADVQAGFLWARPAKPRSEK